MNTILFIMCLSMLMGVLVNSIGVNADVGYITFNNSAVILLHRASNPAKSCLTVKFYVESNELIDLYIFRSDNCIYDQKNMTDLFFNSLYTDTEYHLDYTSDSNMLPTKDYCALLVSKNINRPVLAKYESSENLAFCAGTQAAIIISCVVGCPLLFCCSIVILPLLIKKCKKRLEYNANIDTSEQT